MQYLAYNQGPTSVSEAHKADFLEAGTDSLVQIKHNVIEVHALVASGLRLALSGSIQGIILKTIPVRLRSHQTSGLAVLTTTYQLFVVVFDKEASQIRTLASHSVYERSAVKAVDVVALLAGAGSASESTAPTPYLAIHAFQGLIRVIILDDGAPSAEPSVEGKTAPQADEEERSIDLSRGFVTRIPELLLNSLCILPSPAGQAPRLATIHSNRHGQRVFHTHTINFSLKCIDTYEPGTFDGPTSSFAPSAGITLFDADSQLMIPVECDSAEGVIVVGAESALFFSTATPVKNHSRRKSSTSLPSASAQGSGMQLDEVPEMMATSPRSKGKGRLSEDTATLSTSPVNESATLPGPSGSSTKPAGSTRRRSSASSLHAPNTLAASPTSPKAMEARLGNKRKLSDAANSSGRGKNPARTRSGTLSTMPVECHLPISEYVAYCKCGGNNDSWLLADGWGQAVHLRLSVDAESDPAAISSGKPQGQYPSSPSLATSPSTAPKMPGRRASRTSISKPRTSDMLHLTAEPITQGRLSSPTALVELGGDYVFIGSHFGDSMLARVSIPSAASLESEAESPLDVDMAGEGSKASIQVVSTYTNLAPIVDFCVVDTDAGRGPSHLVACSGGKSDGTLHIVRHGVSIAELASLELEGIQRVFPLQVGPEAERQSLLVVSALNDTRILALSGEEDSAIEELDSLGRFDLAKPTILAGCYATHAFQIVADRVASESATREAPVGSKITLASACGPYILAALSGGQVSLLEISDDGNIQQKALQKMEQEVACLSIDAISPGAGRLVAAVGLWNTYSVVLLDIPTLETIEVIDIGTTFLLRSVLTVALSNDNVYLFVGLGDGSLVSYSYTQGQPSIDKSTKKTASLGTRPITLVKFQTSGNAEAGIPSRPAVLAISDRSTVVSTEGKKLTFASVNMRDIAAAAALSSSSFPDSVLIAGQNTLTIGRVDQLDKLDVQTLRLGDEAPRRVCHSQDMRAYGIAFLQETLDRSLGEISRTSSFKILGEDTFEVLLDHTLNPKEEARSVAVVKLPVDNEAEDLQEYFAVGTAYIEPEVEEATRGRILIFASLGEGRFDLVGETETRGAVHAIGHLPSGKLVATANSEVIVFAWHNSRLVFQASWGATFIAYSLAIKDNLICVVDPLRSASLLRWKDSTNTLVDVGKEYSAYGLFAAAFLEQDTSSTNSLSEDTGEETIIAADLDLNLFTAKNLRIPTTAPGSEVYTLKTQAMIHAGDVINKFARGSLVPAFSRSTDGPAPQVIFATSMGSIGMVATLSPSVSAVLSAVERNLRKMLETTTGSFNIGGLSQEEFRAFKAEYRTQPAVGFIDGSLLETLLVLDKEDIAKVLQGASEYEAINSHSQEEVVRLVEELQRMH